MSSIELLSTGVRSAGHVTPDVSTGVTGSPMGVADRQFDDAEFRGNAAPAHVGGRIVGADTGCGEVVGVLPP